MRTTFRETMTGTIRVDGTSRPVRMVLAAEVPGALVPWGDVTARITGRFTVPGWADDAAAEGTLRIAPMAARRIRYRLDFTAHDGRRLHLDGWKSVSYRHPVRSMTTLPATVTDADHAVVGEATLRFGGLARFLGSFRYRSAPQPDPMRPRWRGQPGRLEVWYTTLTDPATGTGVWLHHELVAPRDGGAARAHGWAAVFPPGAPPVYARFGPGPWKSPEVFETNGITVTADRLSGTAGDVSWDLSASGGGPPLYTFPRWAWRRELLPAAQLVATPGATYSGLVSWGNTALRLASAPGATARIYGRGNAERWAWLHADLGGGDVCEVVAAVSTRPGLRRLRPLPLVRLRLDGRDWPAGDPLLAAARLRADLTLPTWRVEGRLGARRLAITVTQPPESTLALDYADPDGRPAVCRNTERADATITISRAGTVERSWTLTGTAHAEVGTRD